MFTLQWDCEIFYLISINEFSLKLQGFFSFTLFFWEQKKTFLFICQRQQNIKQVGEKLECYIISALKLFSTLHSLSFFFLKAKCIFFNSRAEILLIWTLRTLRVEGFGIKLWQDTRKGMFPFFFVISYFSSVAHSCLTLIQCKLEKKWRWVCVLKEHLNF